jgi:hypothetical protein
VVKRKRKKFPLTPMGVLAPGSAHARPFIFMILMSPCKNSVVLNSGGKKKTRNKKRKIPKIVATFAYASSQGKRTHSARTKIPKIVATFVYVIFSRIILGSNLKMLNLQGNNLSDVNPLVFGPV